MQFTKVRGIAGRADGKARHLALKDSVAVRRADPSERSQRESLWRLRARPFERSSVCEFVCINKNSKPLNSKDELKSWNIIWVCDGLLNKDKRALCYEPAKMSFTPTLRPWPASVYARWVVSSNTNKNSRSTMRIHIWRYDLIHPTGPLRVLSLVSPKTSKCKYIHKPTKEPVHVGASSEKGKRF